MSDCMTQEDAMNMNNEQAIQILRPFMEMMRDQNGCPISDAYFALGKAIDALEPQRKRGKWVHLGGSDWCCSACGHVICTKGSWEHPLERGCRYCEYCDADMRGGQDGYNVT